MTAMIHVLSIRSVETAGLQTSFASMPVSAAKAVILEVRKFHCKISPQAKTDPPYKILSIVDKVSFINAPEDLILQDYKVHYIIDVLLVSRRQKGEYMC